MSFETERQYFENRFHDNWTDGTVDIKWDNVNYTPQHGTSWLELTIVNGDSFLAGLGNPNMDRHTGVLQITVNTPLGEGTSNGRTLAGEAAAIFSGQSFNGIICRKASITRIGERNNWFTYAVSVPYWRDEDSS
jgi:hypothetical protein